MTNHLDWIEAEFRRELAKNEPEFLVAWLKKRILESFKNGRDSRSRTPAKPDHPKAGTR